VSASGPIRIAELTVPAHPDQLAICRLALAGATDHLGVSDGTLADLKLVLSETCSNAIRHGYGGAEGTIDVRFRLIGGEFEVEVTDHGRGLEPNPSRGVGMTVLDELCTRWSVCPPPDGAHGTTVTFAHRLPH
jgi:anti-sigma regulatory factor (Ser/Thr protein kinase)